MKSHTVLIVFLGSIQTCLAVEFRGLGVVKDFSSSLVGTISGDGKVVFGNDTSGPGMSLFRWTESDGMEEFERLPGDGDILFYESTYDGSRAVGRSFGDEGGAFHWTREDGLEFIDPLRSVPFGMSSDGSVIAGLFLNCFCTFRLSEANGFELLPVEPFPDHNAIGATTVSGDGKVIAGIIVLQNDRQGFHWTEEQGYRDLGMLTDPHAASFDGSVIVGHMEGDQDKAYRWMPGQGARPLPTLEEDILSVATDVNSDGSIIVGLAGPEGDHAALWDDIHGVRRVSDMLFDAGIEASVKDFDLWQLSSVEAISDDGYVIVGNGLNPEFLQEAWRIVFDRGDFDIDGSFDVDDIDTLARVLRDRNHSTRYDLNNDKRINREDHRVLVEELAGTYFGDSNLDGEFNSTDLAAVFQAGHYEDSIPVNSNWAQGDWDGNGDFNAGDFVLAFQSGGYEIGARPVQTVPEPKMAAMLVFGFLSLLTKACRSK